MIDIHCHILYGLDDGAQSIEESIKMAQQALREGTHHIFATPHFTNNYQTQYQLILDRISEVQREVDKQNINVKIYPGNEVRLESIDFLKYHIQNNSFHYLGEGDKYILLEQRWSGYDPKIVDAVDYFISHGITPILAHPERHPYIREKPKRLIELIERGAWTQVSVDSMLGKNGEEAEEFSTYLLEGDHLHTIASDAHNTIRKINLAKGYELIQQEKGEAKAQEIQERIKQILLS